MRNRGEPIPEGWILDAQGNPSTNPADLYEPPGAMLPLGDIVAHKGFALSMMVDILSGVISNAGFSREDAPRIGNGVFLTVINISTFMSIEEFATQIKTLIEFIKSSELAPGFDEILIPGEPEARTRKKRLAEGIFIDDETWKQIIEAGKLVGITVAG